MTLYFFLADWAETKCASPSDWFTQVISHCTVVPADYVNVCLGASEHAMIYKIRGIAALEVLRRGQDNPLTASRPKEKNT